MKDDLMALIEARSKKRYRPSELDKARAVALGYKLRGRGRPRRDEPENVFGGRAAQK
jgi:hypothetical protein